MIYVIATNRIKPGMRDKVLELARPCIEATRKEPGVIFYDAHFSVSDENMLVFVECWQDRAALEAHFRQPHLKTWREARAPYIDGAQVEIIAAEHVERL